MFSAETHIENGIEALQSNKFTHAIKHFSQAVTAEPDSATAYKLRGLAHLHVKRLTSALADFDRAKNLAPYDDIAMWGRGKVFFALGDFRWAVVQYTNAIELLPPDSAESIPYYQDRAEAYKALGDRVSAENDLQTAQRLAQLYTFD